tara:strand:+ start:1140 stop:2570 length:1431 start_codon:yes stop_codon:yes gene_type:complete
MSGNMGWLDFLRGSKTATQESTGEVATSQTISESNVPFYVVAGMKDIFSDTESFRSDANYDTIFDLYDNMLKYDPELNGAVRTVSLTANNYRIDYKKAKNSTIRNTIKELVEEAVDLDDILISATRNLMVYGNDINKYVGSSKSGITGLQSLPVNQITITDDRQIPFAADRDNPIMNARRYVFRENKRDTQVFDAGQILHIRIDYRSNWFEDKLDRWTYGVWGASRFSSLKQAIRAKYNTMNNRIALEDSMTKQYITIDASAVEHVSDPNEQRERLEHIMSKVGTLLDSMRADQIPILPHYVNLHHVDIKNTIPDNSKFLDQVNGDIAAVLHVPRVSMGQEQGSTFAATFNANQWSVQAIRRTQQVLVQSIKELFSTHLDLLGIEHRKQDLPMLVFDSIDEESAFQAMQRANIGYSAGLLTLNQSLDMLGLPAVSKKQGGDERIGDSEPVELGELPRENQVMDDDDMSDEMSEDEV